MKIIYTDREKEAKDYTEKYKNEMKPCANCGSEDLQIVYSLSNYPKTRDAWYVKCNSCKFRTVAYSSVKRAVTRWNKRN